MYYTPARSDGTQVPIPWQIKTLYFNIVWPLRDNPAAWMRYLDYLFVAVGTFTYVTVYEGEMLFVVCNLTDINRSIQGLVTGVVMIECILRLFFVAFRKQSCKAFYKKFFGQIYIDAKENAAIARKIQQQLIPNTVYTYGYILTLISFVTFPILRGQNELPYKMILHYNYEHPLVYAFTMFYLSLAGSSVIFFFIGDGYLLAYCILHLNGRYLMLQQEMERCCPVVLSTVPRTQVAAQFHKQVLRSFLKACDLNHFTKILNDFYKFRIFVMIAFSTVLLCVLCFQFASLGLSSENIGYASWLVAKISELLILGMLGSTLIETTDKVSSMYYLSKWEEIVFHSPNQRENVLLMKDLRTIMSLHQNPMRLSGYGFFYVSLDTVIKVLRGAFSYFTCLYTVKQSAE